MTKLREQMKGNGIDFIMDNGEGTYAITPQLKLDFSYRYVYLADVVWENDEGTEILSSDTFTLNKFLPALDKKKSLKLRLFILIIR